MFNVTERHHHRSLRKIFAYLMKIYYEIKEKSVNIKRTGLIQPTILIRIQFNFDV